MKKKLSWRVEWVLFATGFIFFMIAKIILPYFDRIAEAIDQEESGYSWLSPMLFVVAVLLWGVLIGRLVYRSQRRAKRV